MKRNGFHPELSVLICKDAHDASECRLTPVGRVIVYGKKRLKSG
jgi:hypothetical protein